MKIYTAARYARIDEMKEVKKVLEMEGHTVTARWVDGDEEGKSLEAIALLDWEDVIKADMVLVFTDPKGTSWTGGGRHTELGMGYALKKHVWIVGEKEQVFHSLPGVKQFSSLGAVVGALSVFKPEVSMFDNVRSMELRPTDRIVKTKDKLKAFLESYI